MNKTECGSGNTCSRIQQEEEYMYEQLTQKTRIARKEHTCGYCNQKIAKGEEYEYTKYKYDGSLYEWKNHLACGRIAAAIWDYVEPDDGMDDQQFQDGCCDVCHDFICPDCPDWDKEYGECGKDESYCIDRMDAFFKTHELYKAERKSYYQIWKCREKPCGSE